MKTGWITKKLAEVLDIQNGFAFNSKQFSDNGGIPLIRIRDLKSEGKTTAYYTGEYDEKYVVRSGDLLIGMDGEFVCYEWKGSDALLNQRVCRLENFSPEVLPRFLFYGINKFLRDIEDTTTYTTVKHISSRQIKKINFPLPSFSEQKRIVAILDEAFAGIATAVANTEKNVANARELFESYMNSVFVSAPEHWAEAKLGKICAIKHGFAFKSRFFAPEGDYVLLTPGSFWESGGFRDQGKKTKYYTGEIPDGYILKEGDFLVAMTEQAAGLLGSSLIVPESNRYLHNQRLGLVQVEDSVEWHNDFFFHQFNTQAFRASVQATASGVKVRHTSPKKIGAIKVKFPPTKTEQIRVANKLNELLEESRSLEQIYQQKLTALAELKQSLLKKAFSGELTADIDSEVKAAVA